MLANKMQSVSTQVYALRPTNSCGVSDMVKAGSTVIGCSRLYELQYMGLGYNFVTLH